MDRVIECKVCGNLADPTDASAYGRVRGNTARFLGRQFVLWKCPECQSIHSIEPIDYAAVYSDYPLNHRKLDVFARGTFRNLLKRLVREGLKKTDTILDYGCGNGLFVQFLKEQGYASVAGYDPFVRPFDAMPQGLPFDCVIANDVIEHVEEPRDLVADCTRLCKPGGLIYFGTADSEPVDMQALDEHLMRLHQPFHRVIVSSKGLQRLTLGAEVTLLHSYRRSYMDTLMPFSNYRFLDEFNKALGHNMDQAFEPEAGRVIARHPKLLFYAFFGYFLPSAYEPAVVVRKVAERQDAAR